MYKDLDERHFFHYLFLLFHSQQKKENPQKKIFSPLFTLHLFQIYIKKKDNCKCKKWHALPPRVIIIIKKKECPSKIWSTSMNWDKSFGYKSRVVLSVYALFSSRRGLPRGIYLAYRRNSSKQSNKHVWESRVLQ